MKSPASKWKSVFSCAFLVFIPQFHALAATGLASPASPTSPFDDPTWKALVGLAVLVNAFLYFLVWRRRTN